MDGTERAGRDTRRNRNRRGELDERLAAMIRRANEGPWPGECADVGKGWRQLADEGRRGVAPTVWRPGNSRPTHPAWKSHLIQQQQIV